MKKRFLAIMLVLAVCLTALVGCGQQVTHEFFIRWRTDEAETFSYDISLISDAKYKETEKFLDEQIYPINSSIEYDEIKPVSVKGTYVTTLSHNEGQSTYNTVLNYTATYDTADVGGAFAQSLIDKGIAAKQDGEGQYIEITTVINATAVVNSVSLLPVSSERTVKGAYIGKTAQTYNEYKVSTLYGTSGKKYTCQVTYTDMVNQANDKNFTMTYKNVAYDNETLFLVMRCYGAHLLTSAATFYLVSPMDNAETPLTVSLSGSTAYETTVGSKYDGTFYRYLATCGSIRMSMYADSKEKFLGDGYNAQSNKVVKFQQGYLVFTLQDAQMEALGYAG